MSLFFQTSSVKHPMEETAPHFDSGSDLAYGLKVFRGYATVSATDTTYPLINCDGSSATDYVTLPPNCGILAVNIKRTGSVALTNVVSFGVGMSLGTNYPTLVANSLVCLTIPRASVDAGITTYIGQQAISVALDTAFMSGLTNGTRPVLTATGGTASASTRVEVTLLVMSGVPA